MLHCVDGMRTISVFTAWRSHVPTQSIPVSIWYQTQWLDTGICVAGSAADVGWGRRPWTLVTDMTAINSSPVSQALGLITSGNNRCCSPHSQMMRLNLKEVKLWLKVIELFHGKKSEFIPRSPSQGNHKAQSDSLSPQSILGSRSLFSGNYNFTGKTHNSLSDSDLVYHIMTG